MRRPDKIYTRPVSSTPAIKELSSAGLSVAPNRAAARDRPFTPELTKAPGVSEALIGSDNLPLAVDLDGTLIKTDLLSESLLVLLKKHIRFLFLIPVWAARGKAYVNGKLRSASDLIPQPFLTSMSF